MFLMFYLIYWIGLYIVILRVSNHIAGQWPLLRLSVDAMMCSVAFAINSV